MTTIDRNSLGSTLDSIAEALFFKSTITASERTAAARWIAGRQALPGSYRRTDAISVRRAEIGRRLLERCET